MQTERTKQLEYNLSVLKRRDGAITAVLGTAGHVVMYQFNEDEQRWDRKNVEGALFVVERSAAPAHQFVVLNRISSENLVESINDDFQMELTEQFLLYRNSAQEINGIWFYSPDERAVMAELLSSLSAPPAADPPPADDSAAPPTSEAAEREAESHPPPSNGTPTNVTQFLSMVQGQQDAPAMPPMPDGTRAKPALQPAAQPAAQPVPPRTCEASASTSAAGKPPDVESLKEQLRTQLQSLLQDDGFMNVLALEYLRQRKAEKTSGGNKSRPAAAHAGAAAPPAQASAAATPSQLPAHLLSLLKQQAP